MRYVCAWCDEELRQGHPDPIDRISHGICEKCLEEMLEEVRAMTPGDITVRSLRYETFETKEG